LRHKHLNHFELLHYIILYMHISIYFFILIGNNKILLLLLTMPAYGNKTVKMYTNLQFTCFRQFISIIRKYSLFSLDFKKPFILVDIHIKFFLHNFYRKWEAKDSCQLKWWRKIIFNTIFPYTNCFTPLEWILVLNF